MLSVSTENGATLSHPIAVPPGLVPIRGLVLDPQGDPGDGVAVSLISGTSALRSTESASDDSFLLPAAPPGNYVLEAKNREALATAAHNTLQADSAQVELVLHPEAGGRILLAPRIGPSGACLRTVALITDGQRTHILRTLEAPATLTGLQPAVYKVVDYVGGVLNALPTVDLRLEREQRLTLDASEGVQLSVEL